MFLFTGDLLDVSAMELLFEELNFIVSTHCDLTVEEMRKVFKKTASMYADYAYCEGCNFTAFAACILTKEGESDDHFFGADNADMKMQEFFQILTEVPLLKTVPKLVIFQYLQGKEFSNLLEKLVNNIFVTLCQSQM